MTELSPLDELFVHQIPEPLGTLGISHPHWRESYFFEAHDPDPAGDVVALGFATYPQRRQMDAVVLGRIDGTPLFRYVQRNWDGDATTHVGPVRVQVDVPFERLTVQIEDLEDLDVALTFSARTRPYGLRRGRMVDDHGILLWDQSHMIQSGRWRGSYRLGAKQVTVDGWTGQRDHSWGVRDHGRIPMWTWVAAQFDDGMLGVWHWELRNGAVVFTDGCWAPTGKAAPVPVIGFSHELHWTGTGGEVVEWTGAGDEVEGIRGRVEVTLEGGQRLGFGLRGTWAARYRPFHGGGQQLVTFTADDGRSGTGIVELTGHDHHRYFPTGVPAGEWTAT